MLKNLKIKSLGGRGELCQISRIDDGFKMLGHELVDENPDLIYVNDHNYHKEGIELKKKYPTAKLILNCLDLPKHCKEYQQICDELSLNFYFCDAITTISNTVKEQMLSVFPHTQKNGISVIYQPVKPVKPVKLDSAGISVFGRQNDGNKRFSLSLQSAMIAGLNIKVVGPEDPTQFLTPQYKKICKYVGLVSDKQLNVEYNNSSVVLICGVVEGISLSLIEALICKVPVVCCSDMQTAREFCPTEFICEPNPFNIADKIKYVTSGDERISKILDEYSEKYQKQFAPETIAWNIIQTYEKTI